jgi:hypothetical protein
MKVVDLTRHAIKDLIDVEQIWIETAPSFELEEDREKILKKKLLKAKERIEKIYSIYFENLEGDD